MSFIAELKRRNVFRVGLAYVLMGWVLLQGTDFVLDLIGAPDWVIRVFALAVAVGLPIALFFAWAFEMTPEGIKREEDVDRSQSIAPTTGRKLDRTIIALLAFAVIGLLVSRYLPDKEPPDETRDAVEAVAVEQPANSSDNAEPSIAVLPFVDLSPEGDQAYFADGISEEILNVLVKTDRIKVAGRTSSFQFRGREEDLREIGQKLGVNHILEGSLRKSNNRIRITAQLVKADDGFHLWSETYDRELDDVFAIQDEISRAITDALAVHLDLADQQLVQASTRNMIAYDQYLEARALISSRGDLLRAIQLLDNAIELDPGFAPAWAANAQAHALTFYYMEVDREKMFTRATELARHALMLQPDLSYAHSALADIYRDQLQWILAREHYEKALALNPSDVEANEQFAQMLWRLGDIPKALEHSSTAVRLDPLSPIYLSVHGSLLYQSGDREQGWSYLNRSMTVSYQYVDFQARNGVRMALSDDDPERALELMRTLLSTASAPDRIPGALERVERLQELINDPEQAGSYLAGDLPHQYDAGILSLWSIDLAWAAYFGELDVAEKILDRGLLQSEELGLLDSGWLRYPVVQPIWDRNPEALRKALELLNAEAYWRKYSFPPDCHAVGATEYSCS